VVEVKRYDVTVTPAGRYWHIEVPAVDRVTQARHLREVDDMARDLIAIMTDEAPATIELDVRVVLPKSVREHLRAAEELRQESARAQAQAAKELRAAAQTLHEAGLPLRDVGAALGVSYQRAHQLVS
jgi:predicted nucleotidyltransferase